MKNELQAYIKEANEQLNEMLKELDMRVKKVKTCLTDAQELTKLEYQCLSFQVVGKQKCKQCNKELTGIKINCTCGSFCCEECQRAYHFDNIKEVKDEFA